MLISSESDSSAFKLMDSSEFGGDSVPSVRSSLLFFLSLALLFLNQT